MFTRREYEGFFGKVTDEEWRRVEESISDAMDRIYEEDHPLDD